MNLYNRELEEIENKERERRIQAIAEKKISFLVEKYRINESFLRKRLESLSVVEREGKTHFVVQNGKNMKLIAMQVDNINKPNTYDNQVYLASILINSQDNSLINAYFSEDAKKFQEFFKDFDSRQSTTSSKELVSLSINDKKIEAEKRKKYNTDNLFKKKRNC